MTITDFISILSSNIKIITKNNKMYIIDNYRLGQEDYDFGIYSAHSVDDLKNNELTIDDIPGIYIEGYADFMLNDDFKNEYDLPSEEINKLSDAPIDKWAAILRKDKFKTASNDIKNISRVFKRNKFDPLPNGVINAILTAKLSEEESESIDKFETMYS